MATHYVAMLVVFYSKAQWKLFFVLVANCVLRLNSLPLPDGARKLEDSQSVSCVSVSFINNCKRPIKIWKTMSPTTFKGFIISGNIYRMKTMVLNQRKPVVFHAEDLGSNQSDKLLLEGQESLSILPFDCDDKFVNVSVSCRSTLS